MSASASTTGLPSLIVITGAPGSGKSSLSRQVARALRCPLISRDEIKEGLVHTTGASTDDLPPGVYATFFDTVELLLRRRVTLIAEAAFQHKLWAPKLEPLRAIAAIRVVVCSVDPKLARKRHIERGLADPERERFHPDEVIAAAREGREVALTEYDPPHLAEVPLLTVDTTDQYQPGFYDIVAWASRPSQV